MGDSLSRIGVMHANEVEASPKIEHLLLQVLAHVGEELKPDSLPEMNESTQEEVVLDIEIYGVRYLLTRFFPQSDEPQVNLSPREQEIVRLVAKGYPNKVIAAVLDISPWTVSTHLRRVFAKLSVNSRAEMVARVLNEDLLVMEE